MNKFINFRKVKLTLNSIYRSIYNKKMNKFIKFDKIKLTWNSIYGSIYNKKKWTNSFELRRLNLPKIPYIDESIIEK